MSFGPIACSFLALDVPANAERLNAVQAEMDALAQPWLDQQQYPWARIPSAPQPAFSAGGGVAVVIEPGVYRHQAWSPSYGLLEQRAAPTVIYRGRGYFPRGK